MSQLPPWSGDAQAMLRWLEPKLDEKLRDRHNETLNATVASWQKQKAMTPLQKALLNFSKGNAEPLRRYYVAQGDTEAARLVDLPKLKRGEKWNPSGGKKKPVQPPEIAQWAVIIRAIWEEHYGKKQRRRPDWTAEEFAFALYMMDAEVEGFDPKVREPTSEWSGHAADQNKHGKK